MKRIKFLIFFLFSSLTIMSVAMMPTENANAIDPISKEKSLEAFDVMMQVITHPRCMNCHPSDDYPRQGEDSHLHLFGVQRGSDGHGTAAVKCQTCHQTENNNNSGVPGAPEWHLAPLSMGWAGLSKVEIAKSILNTEENGNRSLEEIVEHMTEDELVLWAFEPGVNHAGIARATPPVSEEEWIRAVKEWAENGAAIPQE